MIKLLLTSLTTLGLTVAIIAQNWNAISVTGNIQKIAFNQQIGIAVGDNGTILKSTDGGLTFNSVLSGITDNLVDVKFVGNNSFIACGFVWGSHGIVIKSTDNGSTWNSVISLNGSGNEMFGIYCLSSDSIFVSGTNQFIRTFDGFSTYSTSYFQDGYQYRSLFFNNNLILLAHQGTEIMRKSSDFGNSYTNSLVQPTSNMLRDMIFANNQLFAIGDNGSFSTSADGDNWNMVSTQILNFKSLHELAGIIYTCSTSEVFELNPNGNLTSLYTSNGINSTGTSHDKLFALGNNFIAYKSNCQLNVISHDISAGPDQNICSGDNVTLNGTGGNNYQWNNNVVDGQAFSPSQSNAYVVTAQDTLGCTGTDTVVVTVLENATSTLTETAIDSYTLNGQTYTQSGTYTQTLTAANGCDSVITLILNLNYTGINQSLKSAFCLFPNPASDQLIINANELFNGKPYAIYDQSGKVLLNGILNMPSTSISLSGFTNGIYIFKIEGLGISTFVVQKE